MGDWGRNLTEIAVLFIGVAALALLVSHPSGTSTLFNSTTGGFGRLLSTVENPTGGGTGNSTGGGYQAFPMSVFSVAGGG